MRSTSLAVLAEDSPVTTCSFDFLTRSALYDSEKPYYFSGALEPEQEKHRSNLTYTTHDGIELRDLRGKEHLLDLQIDGFELLRHDPKVMLVDPSEEELQKYLEETSALVKQHLDAELVLAYNFRFRRAPKPSPGKLQGAMGTFNNQDKPVLVPHTDQTLAGGPRRARHHLSDEEAAKYLDGNWRLRILNCWVPLHHAADERPLAMCDFHSIDQADLRSADRASREYVGEIYYLHHNPDQQWYWISGQQPEEMLLFVNYDSDSGNTPSYMPHSSFFNKMADKGVKPRESFEVALIVISCK